jgi:hypothetical protein
MRVVGKRAWFWKARVVGKARSSWEVHGWGRGWEARRLLGSAWLGSEARGWASARVVALQRSQGEVSAILEIRHKQAAGGVKNNLTEECDVPSKT